MNEEEYLEFSAAPEGKDLSIELKGYYLDVYLEGNKWHWSIIQKKGKSDFRERNFNSREEALKSILNKWKEV